MTATAGRILTYNGRIRGTSVDVDALAFITAAGITGLTQVLAIDYLVTALKGASLWTKFIAIYPVVGGTSSTHKFNLKDPRDLDAAYRLTFGGSGTTHNSQGMSGNGTGFANTYIKPNAMAQDDVHVAAYSYAHATSSGADLGVVDGGWSNICFDYIGVEGVQLNNSADGVTVTGGFTTNCSLLIGSRASSTATTMYLRGALIGPNTRASTTRGPTYNYYLFGRNNGGSLQIPTLRTYSFFSFGSNMNGGSDALNYYNIVQNYQRMLSRAV